MLSSSMSASSSLSLQAFSGGSKLMSFEQFNEKFNQPKLLYQHSSDVVQVYQYNETSSSAHSCLVFVHHGTLLQTGRLFKKLIDNNNLMPNIIPYDEAYKDEEEYDASYYMVCRDSNVLNAYQSQQIKTLEDVFNDPSAHHMLNDFVALKSLILDIANGLRQLHRSELTHNNLYAYTVLLVNNKNYDGTSRSQAKRAILQFPGIGISYLLHVGSDINYAPEVTHHTEFSKENDVFMFGLLVLKLLTFRDLNTHAENFEWKKDVQEKISARFGSKSLSPFIRSLTALAKECILSQFRPTSDHLVSRVSALSEKDEKLMSQIGADDYYYEDSFASLGVGDSHYFDSSDAPHLNDYGGEEDFHVHDFDAGPVIIDMDEDDEESDSLSGEVFDKRRKSNRMSVNLSSRKDALKERLNGLNPEEEGKLTGFKKLFSCFFGKYEKIDQDPSNRIDLYTATSNELSQEDALPDYLVEGKKKRETLFCEKLIRRVPSGSIILVKDEKTRTNMTMKKCTKGNEEFYEREIKALKQMDHPYITKYIDSFDYTDDDHYTDHISKHIVLKYYPNSDLEDCFLRKKPKFILSPVLFMKIITQSFDVLSYLNGISRVHGNITPANIVLDDSKNVVFVDFTISWRKDEKITFVVRSNYTAPEHKVGALANPMSDVFSLATSMLELLMGERIDIKTLKNQNMTVIDALRLILGNDNYTHKFSVLLNNSNLNTKNIGEILRDASALEVQNRKPAQQIAKDCANLRDQIAAITIQRYFRGFKVKKLYKDKLPKREQKPSLSRREIRRIKASQSNYAISSISKSSSSYGIAFHNRNNSSILTGISRSTSIDDSIARSLML